MPDYVTVLNRAGAIVGAIGPVVVIALLALLVVRELWMAAAPARAAAVRRIFNIGIIPLYMLFGLVVLLKVREFLAH